MKELIEIIVLSTLGLLAFYLVGCFMCASFNLAEWHYLARMLIGFLMLAIVAATLVAVASRDVKGGVENE